MTTGADSPARPPGQPAEPTFAEVLNGFSLDSGRGSRRRRFGRRRASGTRAGHGGRAGSDVAEGDVAETDAAEKDAAETDVAEGDVAETDVAEGDVAETDAAEGDVADTDAAEGDAAEGDAAEGDAAEKDAAEAVGGAAVDEGARAAARTEQSADGSAPARPAPVGMPPSPSPRAAPVVEPDTGAGRDSAGGAASVRPYSWTGGRTTSTFDLAIEALVSTSERGAEPSAIARVEHRAIAELCGEPRSVAEVAALLSLPLGVARVLLADMAELGLVVVHQTAGDIPDLAVMERVLSGLRRL